MTWCWGGYVGQVSTYVHFHIAFKLTPIDNIANYVITEREDHMYIYMCAEYKQGHVHGFSVGTLDCQL